MTVSGATILRRIARTSYRSFVAVRPPPPINDNAIERLPLFDHFGVPVVSDGGIPISVANVEQDETTNLWAMRWLPADTRLCFGEYSYQLHLPMNSDEFDNVVQLVPPCRYPALDNHFPSMVRRDETLSKLAVILAHRRKLRLGDVVQMSEAELAALLKYNKRALERLRGHVRAYALDFGMRAPRWKSPGGLFGSDW